MSFDCVTPNKQSSVLPVRLNSSNDTFSRYLHVPALASQHPGVHEHVTNEANLDSNTTSVDFSKPRSTTCCPTGRHSVLATISKDFWPNSTRRSPDFATLLDSPFPESVAHGSIVSISGFLDFRFVHFSFAVLYIKDFSSSDSRTARGKHCSKSISHNFAPKLGATRNKHKNTVTYIHSDVASERRMPSILLPAPASIKAINL